MAFVSLRSFVFILLLMAPTVSAFAQSTLEQTILTRYWSEEKDAHIEIYEEAGKYFGKIVWQETPSKDDNNPDPTLRDRDLLGLVFLRDFKFDGKDTWKGGRVYSPDNGKTYKGKMWLTEEGHLKMRGFVGISMLGRTAILERVE